MPSNFQGTWQYARHTAKGSGVVKSPAAITVRDGADNKPETVTVTDPDGSTLNLPVATKTDNDISFQKDTTHRGRLVILSANTPALLIGSISKGIFPLQEDNPHGPGGDNDIDVFIAVKVG
jgi:hypothetical protein